MSHSAELAVTLWLPHGREAELMGRLLETHGLDFVLCQTPGDLFDAIACGTGPVLLSEQSLDRRGWADLLAQLEDQPPWSELPVLIFQAKEARPFAPCLLSKWRSVVALARPIHVPTFSALLLAAVESRRQQYAVRDLVHRLEAANDSLEQRSSLLRRLTLELSAAEQTERRRIATDVHDHLAQLLVLSRIKLRHALKRPHDPSTPGFLTDIDQLLGESLQYTRNLVADLSPQVLQQGGLLAALKWLAEQTTLHGLRVETVMMVEQVTLEPRQAALVYQSVRELLFNVLKHAGVTQATLSAWALSDQALYISVRDQGHGFDTGSLREAHPTKFGLLSIRERIEALHGSFDIRSELGEGTTVTLSIPLNPAPAVTQTLPESVHSTPSAEASRPQVVRTLLVDDHTLMRQGLRTLLAGYADIQIVGEAANGQEAIERAEEYCPDLIIMDVNMPRLNGVAATKEICRRLPTAKVIGLSYDMSTSHAMRDAGAVTCLDKAHAIEELYQVICDLQGAGQGQDA
jgi:signal transduction histidine kinase/ActR/RegA family two-component response regulator